jgi:Inner membrane component of T3SS, cytoplasmic domain/Sigma-54 interaction domain
VSEQPRTQTAPPGQRGGTHTRAHAVTSLLWYGTDTIHALPTGRVITIGSAADCDIVLRGDHVSAHHGRVERRARGLRISDDGSKNGTYREVARAIGVGLRPTFEDEADDGAGFVLAPGATFVLGARSHRFVGLDDAMVQAHPVLLDLLGLDAEIRAASANDDNATWPTPGDLILAADSGGHMLITGEPHTGKRTLARLVHAISKRRDQPLLELEQVPETRAEQGEILKRGAAKGTLVLRIEERGHEIDPAFVSQLFSTSYQVRVVVIARTASIAATALGGKYVAPMMRVELHPLAERRAAIHRLLDQGLARQPSPLRVADLTEDNRRALLMGRWRENLHGLQVAVERLAAIPRGGFSLHRAAQTLGVPRQTFYNWYNDTMRLSIPLVPAARERELALAVGPAPDRT